MNVIGSGRARGAAVVAWAAVALACGPSYQALYEGDARFEHCYALEETGAASMGQRSECWRDWVLRYTYGQTRDRVEYAATRYRALARAPSAPTDEAMMEAAPGEGRETSIAAPAPTSAFAPPPKTLAEVVDAGGPRASNLPGYAPDAGVPVMPPADEGDKPPAKSCGVACDGSWTACKAKCTGAKCQACAASYKKCMTSCFK